MRSSASSAVWSRHHRLREGRWSKRPAIVSPCSYLPTLVLLINQLRATSIACQLPNPISQNTVSSLQAAPRLAFLTNSNPDLVARTWREPKSREIHVITEVSSDLNDSLPVLHWEKKKEAGEQWTSPPQSTSLSNQSQTRTTWKSPSRCMSSSKTALATPSLS